MEQMDRMLGGVSEAVLARALFVVSVACSDLGVCPLALCGEMLPLVKEPLYLRRRWEDIGGSPPPRVAFLTTG